MSSILVIASYWGQRHGDTSPIFMLEKQLESLQLKNHLDRVLVVATQHEVSGLYADILAKFPEVVYRSNISGSYGSWKYAWDLCGSEYDWYFFLEDDYVFALDDFDQRMIELFDDNLGYLCSLYVDNHIYHPTIRHHASVSNGLVHRRALEKADFSSMMGLDIYDNRCQTRWSWALEETGYKVRDFLPHYDAPFYTGSNIWRFNDNPILIKPVQMFDPTIKVVKYV